MVLENAKVSMDDKSGYKRISRSDKATMLFNSLPKEEALHIMNESASIGEFLEAIGERKGGSGYKRFYAFCSKHDIDYNDYFKCEIHRPVNRNKPIDDILVENSTYLNTNSLKQKLISLEILENKCAICGLEGEWNGRPISLHMDHINGVHDDNRLENLRILCPNCHSQTDTYCGRNRTETRVRKKHYCQDCNVEVWNGSLRCKNCHHKTKTTPEVIMARRKVTNRPSKEIILEELKTTSFVKLGKKYGVTDNAIRKWLK